MPFSLLRQLLDVSAAAATTAAAPATHNPALQPQTTPSSFSLSSSVSSVLSSLSFPAMLGALQLAVQVIGGLILLLYGMSTMSAAVKGAAGDNLRGYLASASQTRARGFLVGILSSALLQSSTSVSVMLVSFVSSQLMTFPQTLSILLGAQIGSTVVNQLVALPIGRLALPMIVLGGLTALLVRPMQHKLVHFVAYFFCGFGMMFLANDVLAGAVMALKSYAWFIHLLSGIDEPLLGFIAAAILTVVLQTSSATVSIAVTLVAQHLISLPTGFAFVLGANVGTVATAILVALRGPLAAKRVGVAYLLFKLAGAVVALSVLTQFERMVLSVSPKNNPARVLANAHTIFNVILSVSALPSTGQVAMLTTWLLPGGAVSSDDDAQAHVP